MSENKQAEVAKEIEDTVAMVNGHVVRMKWVVACVKPAMWLLGLIGYSVFYALALYGGTWVVVLALRHAKVLGAH